MNDRFNELRQQYGCGPVQFSGADEALYNRHLLFDDVIDPFKATPREQFEAMARSLRDVISQRWLLTEKTYEEKNPKRVYYLSMEFLLGRSLANNAVNARLADVVLELSEARATSIPRCSRRSPTPGWATADSAGWPPASSTPWPRCASRRWATACATSTASSSRPSTTAGNPSSPTTGCAARSMGGGTAGGSGRSEAELLVRAAGGRAAADPRAAVGAARHPVRPAGRSAMGARRSTRCGSGPRPRPTISTSSASAGATSSARSPKRWPPSP